MKKAYKIWNIKYLVAWIVMLFLSTGLMAQVRTITGTITDETGAGLPGATVRIDGGTIGTVTDIDGRYSIQANETDVLLISFIGYETSVQNVNKRSVIDTNLLPDIQSLEEVVVIGYGEVKKGDLTGAVGIVNAKDLQQYPVSNISQAMQGRVSGVQVTNSTSPGGSVKVIIRGVGSITGSTQPLYIVDGTQMTELNNIDANDIASMSVLKDASAAAIYGNRAANGVVIITTKSGVSGVTKVDVNAEYGMQYVKNKYNMMNTQQFQAYSKELYSTAPLITIKENPWVNEDMKYSTDWFDEIFRPAPIQKYNAAISGGSENSDFRFSTSYFKQEGLQRNTVYDRVNVAVNSNFKLKKLKVGEAINLYANNSGEPTGSGNGPDVMRTIPQMPVYNDSLPYGYGIPTQALTGRVNTYNPVMNADLKRKQTKQFGINGNVYAEIELFKGFTAKSVFNFRGNVSEQVERWPTIDQGIDLSFNTIPLYGITNVRFTTWQSENTLNYNRTFGKHSLNVLGGFSRFSESSRVAWVNGVGVNPDLESVTDGTANPIFGNRVFDKRMESYMGRAIYSFDNKYFFTGSIRNDGSSKFRKVKRGVFPSFSLGWKLSEENFMQTTSWISNLKLRGGYGELGRDLPLDALVDNVGWFYGVYPWSGVTTNRASFVLWDGTDPNLRWEIVKQTNIGVDLGLLKDKILVTADVFSKVSQDMILQVENTASLGWGTNNEKGNVYRNIGSMDNKGFEFSMEYREYTNDDGLNYSLRGNFSYIMNNVTKVSEIGGQSVPLYNSAANQGIQRTVAGESMWHYYGYKTDGLFQSDAEAAAYGEEVEIDGVTKFRAFQPWARAGDVKYVDTNGDGVFDEANDRVVLGSSLPKMFYGVSFDASFKGFDLSLLLEGKAGFKVFNENMFNLTQTNEKANREVSILGNIWSEQNPSGYYPAIKSDAGSYKFSDRHIQDGVYLTLKNIQLGYDMKRVLSGVKDLSKFRIYISATNLLILTNYDGYNPDVWDSAENSQVKGSAGSGIEYQSSARPTPLTLTAGVQIGF